MLTDAFKYWLCLIAIATVTAWFTERMSSGIIFLLAGAAVFVYWMKISRQRKRRTDD